MNSNSYENKRLKLFFVLQLSAVLWFSLLVGWSTGSVDVKSILGGGVPIKQPQFSWLVGIIDQSNGKLFCGGSILTETFVLTAGRCVHHLFMDGIIQSDSIGVIAGDNNRMEEEATEQIVKVVEIYLHPQFIADESYGEPASQLNTKDKTDKKGFLNDLAILKVSPPFNFTETVNSITITEDFSLEKSELISLAGWGITDKKQNTIPTGKAVKSVEIPFNQEQKGVSKKFGFFIQGERLEFDSGIGNNKGLMGACIGDLGGGLICSPLDQKSSEVVLCGVISFGIWCDRYYPTGQSTLITSDMAHWINSIVHPKLWAYISLAALISAILILIPILITIAIRKKKLLSSKV